MVQTREWGNVELKCIVSHSLDNGVRPILEWYELPMSFGQTFFLQMPSKCVAHLKIVWLLMLIMSLLVLGIGLIQDVMNLLEDVLDAFNKLGCFI